jgi:hypothetical protein
MTIEKHYGIRYKRKEDSEWKTLKGAKFDNLDAALNCERSEKASNGKDFDYEIEMNVVENFED